MAGKKLLQRHSLCQIQRHFHGPIPFYVIQKRYISNVQKNLVQMIVSNLPHKQARIQSYRNPAALREIESIQRHPVALNGAPVSQSSLATARDSPTVIG